MKTFYILCIAVLLLAFGSSCKKTAKSDSILTVDSLKVGLYGYFPFNNTVADSSGTGFIEATAYNLTSATNRFNKPNSAFYFDGGSGYVVVKDNRSLNLVNSDYSINVWMNLDDYNSSYGAEILSKRGPNKSGWHLGITGTLSAQNSGLALGLPIYQESGGTDPVAYATKTISLHQWHMITITYSLHKQQLSYYIDGAFNSVTNDYYTPYPSLDLYVGRDSQGTGDGSYVKGKLDDIRFYLRALNIEQIKKLYDLPY